MKKPVIGQLKQSEVFYRHLAELTPDAVVVHNNGKIVFVNPAAVHLIGATSAEQLIGRDILEFVHPDSQQIVIERITNMMQDGKPTPVIEEKFIDSQGNTLIAQVRTTPFEIEGKPAALTILRDITRQKQDQEELKKSRDQLGAILSNVADGITVQNAQGKIIYVNLAAARATGFPTEEAMIAGDYKSKFDLFDEEGKPISYEKLPGRRALSGEKNPTATVKYIKKETGEVRWSVVKATAILDELGKPTFIVNVLNDITDRMELEQKKDDFISMASHELKTPLTSMNIYSDILQKHLQSSGDNKGVSLQAKINKQLHHLTELVRELLDVTNIEKGKLQLKKEHFLMRDLAEEISESLQHLSKHRIILDWHTKYPVYADRERLRQVLINLISNAIKYSPEGSNIILSSQKKDSNIVISVKDFGIGIAKKDFTKVFGRFYRAGAGEDKTYPGLGLGLYISQQIITLHGGKMWLESEEGKGSIFYFSLPIAKQ